MLNALPMHDPEPLQWSGAVHALLSLQETLLAAPVCVHPWIESHPSTVQILLSSHDTAVPMHVPAPLQWSLVVQTLLSLHCTEVLAGGCVHPVDVLQSSMVHTLLSSQESGAPGTQVPAPLHWSPFVHALESVHAVPLDLGGLLQIPVEGAQVPTS
jgi:hypothetical protein